MKYNALDNLKVRAISERVIQVAKDTFSDKLDKVYLYGSYARGDYDSESDIDFFILADISQEEACRQRQSVSKRLECIDLEYDLLVSCGVTSSELFNQYITDLPFYMNVANEGMILSE